MTADQVLAQQMRREVKRQCLWCGSSKDMQHPYAWDPEAASTAFPAGMCLRCYGSYDAKATRDP